MPTYDYTCSACLNTFEKVLKIADMKQPESEPCPKCGAISVSKVILTANAHQYGLGAEAKNNYGGFGEVLERIHKGNHGSVINRDFR